jgi:hypothetical protein
VLRNLSQADAPQSNVKVRYTSLTIDEYMNNMHKFCSSLINHFPPLCRYNQSDILSPDGNKCLKWIADYINRELE